MTLQELCQAGFREHMAEDTGTGHCTAGWLCTIQVVLCIDDFNSKVRGNSLYQQPFRKSTLIKNVRQAQIYDI